MKEKFKKKKQLPNTVFHCKHFRRLKKDETKSQIVNCKLYLSLLASMFTICGGSGGGGGRGYTSVFWDLSKERLTAS